MEKIFKDCIFDFSNFVFFVSKKFLLILLGMVVFLFLILELSRFKISKLNKFLFKKLLAIFKKEEQKKFSAITLFLIASFLTILFFEKEIAIVALFFLTIGDAAAEIIGLKFGKTKIFKKSLEGSLACFFSCLVIGLILLRFLELNFVLILAGALAATFIELMPIRLEDNFTIPLFTAIVMSLVKMI